MPCSYPAPVLELLAAYAEADLMAAVHLQALHTQGYPLVLCQNGARLEFKRLYRKLLAYSTTPPPPAMPCYHDGPDFDYPLDYCPPTLLPARRRWPRRVLGAVLLGLLVALQCCG